MQDPLENRSGSLNRRSFLKSGAVAGGAAAITAAAFSTSLSALPNHGDQDDPNEGANAQRLTRGDIAILRFVAAAELIESDLWSQYAELGGVTDGTPNNYQTA